MYLNRIWISRTFHPTLLNLLYKSTCQVLEVVSSSILHKFSPQCYSWEFGIFLRMSVGVRKGTRKGASYPKSSLEVAQRKKLGNLVEEMTRRKLYRVSGTMWNSKIRKTVANLSIKAGNMIHLFPFMQTQVYEGLCENYFSLAEPQRHRIKVLLLDILTFLSFFFSSVSSISCGYYG